MSITSTKRNCGSNLLLNNKFLVDSRDSNKKTRIGYESYFVTAASFLFFAELPKQFSS